MMYKQISHVHPMKYQAAIINKLTDVDVERGGQVLWGQSGLAHRDQYNRSC